MRPSPLGPIGPPADPFTGTPADLWADGAAGIVLPAAEAMGPYSQEQVEYAYQTTRKLLIAASLDKQTLLGGAPTAFADLLSNEQRATFLSGLNQVGLDKKGHPLSTRKWVMSFAPGSAELIGRVIKVHGSMHAKAVRNSDGSYELDVVADYLFTYPIEPPHRPSLWMRVVREDKWTVQFADWHGAATMFEPWVIWGGFTSGIQCGSTDGYRHPDYATEPASTPSGTPVDPYVTGQSLVEVCNASTGT